MHDQFKFFSLPVVKGEEEMVETGSDVDPASATFEGWSDFNKDDLRLSLVSEKATDDRFEADFG